MAKRIAQSTFDDVVEENMSEFDMAVEEAVTDAAAQFAAQDVDLSLLAATPSAWAALHNKVHLHCRLSACIPSRLSSILPRIPACLSSPSPFSSLSLSLSYPPSPFSFLVISLPLLPSPSQFPFLFVSPSLSIPCFTSRFCSRSSSCLSSCRSFFY